MFSFLGNKLRQLFKGKVDENLLEEMEELFYEADLGAQTSSELTEKVRQLSLKNPKISSQEILDEVRAELESLLDLPPPPLPEGSPRVILIVGVNGNGKTTTIAKLANRYKKEGKSVIIGAADTFRAAATEQLELWANRLDVPLVKGQHGSDPAAVAFDTVTAAKSRGADIVLIDTAGRLHTKVDLMQELEKIRRVCDKAYPGAPHETWLVLDATIGQNGLDQAQVFHKHTPLTGLVLTKLDGSAKGGTAISLQKKLGIPIRYIGTGESVEDLSLFDKGRFIKQLLS